MLDSKFPKIKERFMKPVVFDEYIWNYDVSRQNCCNYFLVYKRPSGLNLILKMNISLVGYVVCGVY